MGNMSQFMNYIFFFSETFCVIADAPICFSLVIVCMYVCVCVFLTHFQWMPERLVHFFFFGILTIRVKIYYDLLTFSTIDQCDIFAICVRFSCAQ